MVTKQSRYKRYARRKIDTSLAVLAMTVVVTALFFNSMWEMLRAIGETREIPGARRLFARARLAA